MPASGPLRRSARCDLRQEVQGGEPSRPQLHERQARTTHARHRVKYRSLSRGDGHSGSSGACDCEGQNSATAGQDCRLEGTMRRLKEIEVQLNAAPDGQVSLTDPDARSMKTRGTGVVGYNVQTAVDTKHHLIVAHVVTNDGIDRDQLTSMAKLARTEMAVDKLTAVADRGYYKSEEILACHEAGISVFVPKTGTSSATAHGRFGKDDFI